MGQASSPVSLKGQVVVQGEAFCELSKLPLGVGSIESGCRRQLEARSHLCAQNRQAGFDWGECFQLYSRQAYYRPASRSSAVKMVESVTKPLRVPNA